MSDELKPCPFCGKKPSIQRSGPGNLVWYIECDSPLTENEAAIHRDNNPLNNTRTNIEVVTIPEMET